MPSLSSGVRKMVSPATLARKMAICLFSSTIFALIVGMLILFNSTSREAARMNAYMNQDNLNIARNNIEKQVSNMESAILSIFFRDDVLRGLTVVDDSAMDTRTHGRIIAGLNTLMATTPEILGVGIYMVNGNNVVTTAGSSSYFSDYRGCVDYFESIGVEHSRYETSNTWVGLIDVPQRAYRQEYCFVNIRSLRNVRLGKVSAVMVIYFREESINKLFSFFGAGSFMMDKQGYIVSSGDSSNLGDNIYGSELYTDIVSSWKRTGASGHGIGEDTGVLSTYLPSLGFYLSLIPDDSMLNVTVSTVLNTMLLLIGFGTVFSLLASAFLARGLTRPIADLKATMEKVYTGDYSVRFAGKRKDEASYLGGTFNVLLDSLESHIKMIQSSERQKTEAEMNFLQSQINPHLLYNTLDSAIYYISLNDNETARQMLFELSAFFKLMLIKESSFVPLAEEIEHVRLYMNIQRLCRKKNIELSIEGIADHLSTLIVKTTIQPIVENSFIHAYEGSVDDGTIGIRVFEDGSDLVIAVTDDGVGIEESRLGPLRECICSKTSTTGSFGLWNVNRRLKACYGDRYGLVIDSEFGEYTTVTVRIPVSPEYVPGEDGAEGQ